MVFLGRNLAGSHNGWSPLVANLSIAFLEADYFLSETRQFGLLVGSC